MSVTGLCQVCESTEAEFQCGRCGTLVCETHYDREHGLCVQCATEAGQRNGDGGRPGDADTDTHQF